MSDIVEKLRTRNGDPIRRAAADEIEARGAKILTLEKWLGECESYMRNAANGLKADDPMDSMGLFLGNRAAEVRKVLADMEGPMTWQAEERAAALIAENKRFREALLDITYLDNGPGPSGVFVAHREDSDLSELYPWLKELHRGTDQ